MIISSDGKIADIGSDAEMALKYSEAKFEHEVDASGKCILPGTNPINT